MLAPEMPEAAFDRAWLLDQLHLRGQAAAAWHRYLDLDADSPWAGEARERLAILEADPGDPRRSILDSARALADNLPVAVAADPQAAREVALDELLGTWGKRYSAGDDVDAEASLIAAEAIGAALVEQGGDRTIADSCATIRRAQESWQGACSRTLANAHRALAAGLAAYAGSHLDDAQQRFTRAQLDLSRCGSPAAGWAEAGRAGVDLYRGDSASAERRLTSILDALDARAYPALAGRVQWGLGLQRVRRGDFTAALRTYRIAADHFSRAGESANLGAVQTLVAEDLLFLGHELLAWRHRFDAARLLSAAGEPRRLHNLLWEAAEAARDADLPHAALAIQDEGLGVARRLGDPVVLAEVSAVA